MFAGMAVNLQRLLRSDKLPGGVAQDTLLVYNRTSSKADALVKDASLGSKLADSPSAMVQPCSIICVMLADDAACGAVIEEMAQAGLKGKIIINHSTNTPDFTKRAASMVEAAGGAYLAAPVWGR